jgi:hypothetical protein
MNSPKQRLAPGVTSGSRTITPPKLSSQGQIPSRVSELILQASYGDATKQLTDLIMAAEKAFDNFGKRSLFGRDKGKEAEDKFTAAMMYAIFALERVGKIKNAKDADESFTALDNAMSQVRKAFPNWPRAYRYWDTFYAGR